MDKGDACIEHDPDGQSSDHSMRQPVGREKTTHPVNLVCMLRSSWFRTRYHHCMSPAQFKARASRALDKCRPLYVTSNTSAVVSRVVASNAKGHDGQPSSHVSMKSYNLVHRFLASDDFVKSRARVRCADIASICSRAEETVNLNLTVTR